MKLDTHVHTVYSGKSTLMPLDRIRRRSARDLVSSPRAPLPLLPEVA